MGTTLLVLTVVSLATSLAIWVSIAVAAAVLELGMKKTFSWKLLSEIKSNMAASVKSMPVCMAVCTIMVFASYALSLRARPSAEKSGCACRCEKCENAARRVEAVIRYLALDDEDLYGDKENN